MSFHANSAAPVISSVSSVTSKKEATSNVAPIGSLLKSDSYVPEKIFSEATEFSDNEKSLLRATPLCDVLKMGAALLQNSAGEASTYNLSEVVQTIETFLSHNWSVPRIRKFVALSMHYNLFSAVLVSSICAALCFSIQASGLVAPLIDIAPYLRVADEDPSKEGVLVRVVVFPVFLCVLFLKHDIQRFMGRGPLVFLDKTCIHQTDPLLQRKGIMKLGAFIANSERMLILYSDVYFKKLWTIYEVACFLTSKTTDCLEVVHVSLIAGLLFSGGVLYVCNLLLSIPGVPYSVAYMLYPIGWGGTAVYNWRGHRELSSTWQHLAEFQVRNALCSDERDRPKVEKNIETFMKARAYVSEDTSSENALVAFDCIIQGHMSAVMKRAIGTRPLPSPYVFLLACFFVLPNWADRTSAFAATYGMLHVRTWVVFVIHLTNVFSQLPLHAELLAWMTSLFQNTSGIKAWLWISCSWLLTMVSLLFSASVVSWRWLFPNIDEGYLITCIVYHAVWLVMGAAVWFYRCVPTQAVSRPIEEALQHTSQRRQVCRNSSETTAYHDYVRSCKRIEPEVDNLLE